MEEINISEFLRYYFSKIVIVILCTLLGIVVSMYYTSKIQVPLYKSETTIVLANQTTDITVNDVSLNKNLAPTYREIIKSKRVLSKVITNLNLTLTEEELNKKVSVKSATDTELIVISVVDEDSTLAMNIANETAEIFQEEITNYYPIENVNILDIATASEEPYNVNILKQYIIGLGIGFLIGSGIIFLIFYFDDTIKGVEDIETKLNLSVLSTVPMYKPKKKKRGDDE